MACRFINEGNRELISIEDTNFHWTPNFAGDPSKSNVGSTERNGALIIPEPEFAQILADKGVTVKYKSNDDIDNSMPSEDWDGDLKSPHFFAYIKANYGEDDWRNPKIYIVRNNHPRLLSEDELKELDINPNSIIRVNALLSPYSSDRFKNKTTLYIRTMYVEVNDETDPYYGRYDWDD